MVNPHLSQPASLGCRQIIVDPDTVTIVVETMTPVGLALVRMLEHRYREVRLTAREAPATGQTSEPGHIVAEPVHGCVQSSAEKKATVVLVRHHVRILIMSNLSHFSKQCMKPDSVDALRVDQH
jgi:hypothetical protein